MRLGPRSRKLLLTVHVATTVGWLGGVSVVLALAVIGLVDQDAATARGAYLVMDPVGRWVLVPFAFASLATGVLQGLGTPWGLFRYYWVLIKLVLTTGATAVLVLYLRTFDAMAGRAADLGADLGTVRNPSPVVHSVLAVLVLCLSTALATYKPRGRLGAARRAAGSS